MQGSVTTQLVAAVRTPKMTFFFNINSEKKKKKKKKKGKRRSP